METITQLALKWRKYWVRREDWRKAVATRDPELAIEIAAKALKNAAELGLSMLTFITYNVETGQTTVVKQVIRSLLERCFPEKKDYERALAKLVKESKIRTTMSYERNDPGMPWILYAIRDGNYYFEQKDGNWSQISREHLKTLHGSTASTRRARELGNPNSIAIYGGSVSSCGWRHLGSPCRLHNR